MVGETSFSVTQRRASIGLRECLFAEMLQMILQRFSGVMMTMNHKRPQEASSRSHEIGYKAVARNPTSSFTFLKVDFSDGFSSLHSGECKHHKLFQEHM